MGRGSFEGLVVVLGFSAANLGCNAHTRAVPVASAVIVHACAVAEADFYIRTAQSRNFDKSSVEKTTIHLETGGDSKAEIGQEALGALTIGGSRSAGKAIDVELATLPTLAQCQAWGYLLQLGDGGCLRSKTCGPARAWPVEKPLPPPGANAMPLAKPPGSLARLTKEDDGLAFKREAAELVGLERGGSDEAGT